MKWTTQDFDYELPADLIAFAPPKERSGSRMLRISRETQTVADGAFTDIVNFFQPNDVLILNDTKVFPARLYGRKQSGGKIECLIERLTSDKTALAHIKSSKSPKPGSQLVFADQYIATVVARHDALFELEFSIESSLLAFLNEFGEIPLPPYIERKPDASDVERYQTVFADKTGAVAAPTAGLHFDASILAAIKEQGVAIEYLTLHVGAGTFQPVRVEQLDQHKMHSEWIDVSASLCAAIENCQANNGRVIAVGTTVLRALESASLSGKILPYQGETDIFIYPGFTFNCVDVLLTNFHLPKSTLLMLVAALTGYDLMRGAYQHAIEQRYRFFSYGDCMLIS